MSKQDFQDVLSEIAGKYIPKYTCTVPYGEYEILEKSENENGTFSIKIKSPAYKEGKRVGQFIALLNRVTFKDDGDIVVYKNASIDEEPNKKAYVMFVPQGEMFMTDDANTQLDETCEALGKSIKEAFANVGKKLCEYVSDMKKTYVEHKDEIDAEVEKYRLERERLQRSMPKIFKGDIVRIKSIHSSELSCYEVSQAEFSGVVSQPAGFCHDYNEIVAVYRFDGTDFKCIWEREDYKTNKVKG